MRGVKAGDRLRSPVERILARVVITETGCWEFTGSRQKRWSRTLTDRATYRDDRVRGIAGRELCKARRHRFPGLRGCHQCASDIAAAWEGREP